MNLVYILSGNAVFWWLDKRVTILRQSIITMSESALHVLVYAHLIMFFVSWSEFGLSSGPWYLTLWKKWICLLTSHCSRKSDNFERSSILQNLLCALGIYVPPNFTLCMISNHLSYPRLQSDSSFTTFLAWCDMIKWKCECDKLQYTVKPVLEDYTMNHKCDRLR